MSRDWVFRKSIVDCKYKIIGNTATSLSLKSGEYMATVSVCTQIQATDNNACLYY
jgi:hypothetical protein